MNKRLRLFYMTIAVLIHVAAFALCRIIYDATHLVENVFFAVVIYYTLSIASLVRCYRMEDGQKVAKPADGRNLRWRMLWLVVILVALCNTSVLHQILSIQNPQFLILTGLGILLGAALMCIERTATIYRCMYAAVFLFVSTLAAFVPNDYVNRAELIMLLFAALSIRLSGNVALLYWEKQNTRATAG
jgi:hypothetical protein